MKRIISVILCVLCCITLFGCSGKKPGIKMNIYYVNVERNALVQEEYYRQEEELESSIQEVIKALENPESQKEVKSVFPKGVKIDSFRVNSQYLELVFNEEYRQMSKSTEVLLRAAIVQTLVQLPEIRYVSFYIGDEALRDLSGSMIGYMSAEDFLQNTGSSLKSYQTTDLKLYFSNTDGTALRTEKRSNIRYGVNSSVEKLVVEQLMKGTSSDKRNDTIPKSVKLLGVSMKDGICYVNFDSTFLIEGFNQKPEVTIYSIVNSIIENGNVTQVQILVDGSNDVVFNTISLKEPLQWNADVVEE